VGSLTSHKPIGLHGLLRRKLNFICTYNGCKTWFLTLREELRLRASENRVLRIFRIKRDEVTGGWGRICNKLFHNFYSSPRIIRMVKSKGMRWARQVTRMGRRRMHK
jgi:hypothetical protein